MQLFDKLCLNNAQFITNSGSSGGNSGHEISSVTGFYCGLQDKVGKVLNLGYNTEKKQAIKLKIDPALTLVNIQDCLS